MQAQENLYKMVFYLNDVSPFKGYKWPNYGVILIPN